MKEYKTKVKEYRIYIRSNEHPRTINTPRNGRCWYSIIEVYGMDALKAKVQELLNAGEVINEICTGYGRRVYL